MVILFGLKEEHLHPAIIYGDNPSIFPMVCVFSNFLFIVGIPYGCMHIGGAVALRWRPLEENPLPFMGSSVERWPPEEAGRETAGNWSNATKECGEKGHHTQPLTLRTTYVMRTCHAATNTVKLTGVRKEVRAPLLLIRDASNLGRMLAEKVEETIVFGSPPFGIPP